MARFKTAIVKLLAAFAICVWALLFIRTSFAQTTPAFFSGEPHLVVANGYSTTRHWPDVLQRKLNRYFEGEQIMEVINTYESGTPIAKWIDLAAGERDNKWKKTLQPVLQGETQRPVILLAQQSLQWVFSDDRYEGIENENDAARIQQGANAIEMFVNFAKEDGADVVFMATHIYKWDYEPVIENEKYGLEEALSRNIANFYAGPDVWTPTSDHFPIAFGRDQHHPSEAGDEIIAHFWFARMLKFDGKDVPAWSREEMDAAIAAGGGDPGGNAPPVADLKTDVTVGKAPLTVTFDASGSYDEDGILVAHDWDFADGTNDAGEIVTHTFTANGTYPVTLTLVDDLGQATTAQVTITVSDNPVSAYGDVSGDGGVSALDAASVLEHATGVSTLPSDVLLNADVSANGTISPLDAALILEYVVGLRTCFPAEEGC